MLHFSRHIFSFNCATLSDVGLSLVGELRVSLLVTPWHWLIAAAIWMGLGLVATGHKLSLCCDHSWVPDSLRLFRNPTTPCPSSLHAKQWRQIGSFHSVRVGHACGLPFFCGCCFISLLSHSCMTGWLMTGLAAEIWEVVSQIASHCFSDSTIMC